MGLDDLGLNGTVPDKAVFSGPDTGGTQIPVILDVDTGSDDAVAIMTALKSPALKVEAICTVWGNLSVPKTTQNTLGVCQALHKRIPVYEGCRRPMVKDRSCCRDLENAYQPVFKDGKELKIHYDRLEGLPELTTKQEPEHAVRFYYEYLRKTAVPVTIVAVGPLTNLGFLFRLAPELSKKVERLIIMGGGIDVTNCSPAGEANLWHDPEAFQIILDTGIKPLLIPLDATHSAPFTEEDCRLIEEPGTFEARFTARLIRQRIAYESALLGPERNWSPIHDALAVSACIDESVLTDIRELNCRIGLSGASDGELLPDRRALPEKPNLRVAMSANKERFLDMVCRCMAGAGEGPERAGLKNRQAAADERRRE